MDGKTMQVRPGGTAYVSPEGIVHSTDGKYRWVYQLNRWTDRSQWLDGVKWYGIAGAVLGVLSLLWKVEGGVGTAIGLFLALTALGVVLYGLELLTGGKTKCLLFTMDEEMVSCQQVKGKADKDKVLHTVSVWVGGQSNPSLQFEKYVETAFFGVRSIVADRARGQFRLSGKSGRICIRVEGAQFDFVLEQMNKTCPGKVQEK